jgi:hypothetical protein
MADEILGAVNELRGKVEAFREFLEDVFLTAGEYLMVREVDKVVAEKRYGELAPLDEL